VNKALICVDVQSDFLPGGALGVPDGDKVIDPLIKLMDDVDIIVLTRDWHPKDHVSFSADPQYVDGSWPSHCVEFTTGASWNLDLLVAAQNTGKPVLIVNKGMDPNKEAYSGFEGEVDVLAFDYRTEPEGLVTYVPLATALHSLNVRQVYIGGLALDYCVQATAIDAAPSFITSVFMDATRPVAYLSGMEAVANMDSHGIDINTRKV
jgi:nicotinamidase/pyrazinamidase